MAFKQALPLYIPEEQPKPKIYRQTKKEKKQIKIESKNTIKQPMTWDLTLTQFGKL